MRSSLPFTIAWRWRLDVATLEQVVQAADPIPAIAVSLEQQAMPSIFPSSAVAFGQQIYKHAGFITSPDRKRTRLNSSHRCSSYAVFWFFPVHLVLLSFPTRRSSDSSFYYRVALASRCRYA